MIGEDRSIGKLNDVDAFFSFFHSVDAFIQREKYLKGTYESLSGLEMDMKQAVEFQGKNRGFAFSQIFRMN